MTRVARGDLVGEVGRVRGRRYEVRAGPMQKQRRLCIRPRGCDQAAYLAVHLKCSLICKFFWNSPFQRRRTCQNLDSFPYSSYSMHIRPRMPARNALNLMGLLTESMKNPRGKLNKEQQ